MDELMLGVWILFILAFPGMAAERHSDPDGCFSCHGLPGLEYVDQEGVVRTATILQSDYYGSLHGSVPCKDCHRKTERYPHKPEETDVDCSESCHLNEPSKDKPFTHQEVVEEFRKSVHGAGHAPGATRDFRGGNRLKEESEAQNPSCRRCHSNTPYIKEAQMDRFKEAFHHIETECGSCHAGETWRNQFSGHILRRLVGKNYSKADSNAMCIGCHGDVKAMRKVKIEDPETRENKPASFRFIHAVDSYHKTLHGRLLTDGEESGADCIDCHAPQGFRHGVMRDESSSSPTHPAHLPDTCGATGCHGYAHSPFSAGFVATDLHSVGWLRLDWLPSVLDFESLDSYWYRMMWSLGPVAVCFALGSLFWYFQRPSDRTSTAVLGDQRFQRVMIGVESGAGEGFWLRFLARFGGKKPGLEPKLADSAAAPADDMAATLLFASQTGNGEGIAQDFKARTEARGYRIRIMDLAQYDPLSIIHERLLFLITSTHGDGEPALPAQKLHAYLHGDTAPSLENLQYAVFALGDSRYRQFCKAGKDFDAVLAKLGARRVLERVDADADFEEAAHAWRQAVLEIYRSLTGDNGVGDDSQAEVDLPAASTMVNYGKTNPYPAKILVNFNLNGEGSVKETRHIEIDLGDSGLSYEAGDALGVYPKNNPIYVEAFLSALKMDGYSEVVLGRETLTLREAFFNRLDITALSRVLIEKYAALIDGDPLRDLLRDSEADRFRDYSYGRHILDLVEDYPPVGVTPQAFADVLRRIPARLYSIASSMKAVGHQVHLTVGVVRYQAHDRKREGVCSTFLAERLGQEEKLGVFVQSNKHFRPPTDPAAPMIMVGPGTGIAPFRGFLQERAATGAKGRNWLFFGDQRRATDFLYAEELAEQQRRGLLTRLDLAFSRDQAEKIYVQTRMMENAHDLYAWLEEGACFYVCGDAARMAVDVHEALAGIVAKEGSISREKAEEYLQNLSDSKRYLRDVY